MFSAALIIRYQSLNICAFSVVFIYTDFIFRAILTLISFTWKPRRQIRQIGHKPIITHAFHKIFLHHIYSFNIIPIYLKLAIFHKMYNEVRIFWYMYFSNVITHSDQLLFFFEKINFWS